MCVSLIENNQLMLIDKNNQLMLIMRHPFDSHMEYTLPFKYHDMN